LVRNYRKGPGEVDLIAEATQASPPPALAGELVFCEVKTRAYRRDAEPMLEAVPRAKRRKIALTALAFCQERKIEAFMRFDVIAVSATGRAGDGVKVVLHLPHAFTTDDLGIHG
jgi:Holliday junction resolvase-like predicted endonuclease